MKTLKIILVRLFALYILAGLTVGAFVAMMEWPLVFGCVFITSVLFSSGMERLVYRERV